MPTYDYGCDACGATWEIEQRISEDPIKKCPKCNKRKARRLISGGNFILKGGGWYADGYGSSSSSAKSGDAGKSGDAAKSSDAGKSGDAAKSSDGGKPSGAKKSKKASSKASGSSD